MFKGERNDECEFCPKGNYTKGGFPFPTSCTPCPEGRTTAGKGAYSLEQVSIRYSHL
jgi:hypothetical protein